MENQILEFHMNEIFCNSPAVTILLFDSGGCPSPGVPGVFVVVAEGVCVVGGFVGDGVGAAVGVGVVVGVGTGFCTGNPRKSQTSGVCLVKIMLQAPF